MLLFDGIEEGLETGTRLGRNECHKKSAMWAMGKRSESIICVGQNNLASEELQVGVDQVD